MPVQPVAARSLIAMDVSKKLVKHFVNALNRVATVPATHKLVIFAVSFLLVLAKPPSAGTPVNGRGAAPQQCGKPLASALAPSVFQIRGHERDNNG